MSRQATYRWNKRPRLKMSEGRWFCIELSPPGWSPVGQGATPFDAWSSYFDQWDFCLTGELP